MNKFIMVLLILFCANIPLLYAQYGDYYDGTNSYDYDDRSTKSKKKKSAYQNKSHYIGISPSLYIPTGKGAYIKDYTGIGGGVDLRYKYNLHKIFALATTVRYNYAGGSDSYDNTTKDVDFHLLDFQVLAVLQYDDVVATKGFIPYISAGMDVAVSITSEKTTLSSYKTDADGASYPVSTITTKENSSASNVGFIVGAGLRYSFANNLVVGLGVDYTYIFTNHDFSGVRVFLDLGYKF